MSTLLPIDVIIPAWGEKYAQNLQRALTSAADATGRIVVGDAHTLQAGGQHGATHLVPLTTKHPGPGRMQGLAIATQPYVLFMDADDAIIPGGLTHLYNILQSHPKAVAAAGYFQRSTDGTYWPKPMHARIATSPIGLHALMFKNMLPAHGSILMRRHVLQELPEPFETAVINEDWHGIIRLRAAGRIIFTHQPIYDYRVTVGSMSRSPRDLALVQHSHDTLLDTAEKSLGHRALTLRLANRLAKPRRDNHIRETYALYQQADPNTPIADIDYDAE